MEGKSIGANERHGAALKLFLALLVIYSAAGFFSLPASAADPFYVNVSTDPNPELPGQGAGRNKLIYTGTTENVSIFVNNTNTSSITSITVYIPRLVNTSEVWYYRVDDNQTNRTMYNISTILAPSLIKCPFHEDPLKYWQLTAYDDYPAVPDGLIDWFNCKERVGTNKPILTNGTAWINFSVKAVQPFYRDETLDWNIRALLGGNPVWVTKQTTTVLPLHLYIDPTYENRKKNRGQVFPFDIVLNVSPYARGNVSNANVNLTLGADFSFLPPEDHYEDHAKPSAHYSVHMWRETLFKRGNVRRGRIHMAYAGNSTLVPNITVSGSLIVYCQDCVGLESIYTRIIQCENLPTNFNYSLSKNGSSQTINRLDYNMSLGNSPVSFDCVYEGQGVLDANMRLYTQGGFSYVLWYGKTLMIGPPDGVLLQEPTFSSISLNTQGLDYSPNESTVDVSAIFLAQGENFSQTSYAYTEVMGPRLNLYAFAKGTDTGTSLEHALTRVLAINVTNITKGYLGVSNATQERGKKVNFTLNMTWFDGEPLWGLNLDLHPNTESDLEDRKKVDLQYRVCDPANLSNCNYSHYEYLNFSESASKPGTYWHVYKVGMGMPRRPYSLQFFPALSGNNPDYGFTISPNVFADVFTPSPTDQVSLALSTLLPWPDMQGQLVGVEINVTDPLGEPVDPEETGYSEFNVTVTRPDGFDESVTVYGDAPGVYRGYYTIPFSYPLQTFNVSLAYLDSLGNNNFDPSKKMRTNGSYPEKFSENTSYSEYGYYFKQAINFSDFGYEGFVSLKKVCFNVTGLPQGEVNLSLRVLDANNTTLHETNGILMEEPGLVEVMLPYFVFERGSGFDVYVELNESNYTNFDVAIGNETHTFNFLGFYLEGSTVYEYPNDVFFKYDFGNYTFGNFTTTFDSIVANFVLNESLSGSVLPDASVKLSWIDAESKNYSLTKYTNQYGLVSFVLPINVSKNTTFNFSLSAFGFEQTELFNITVNGTNKTAMYKVLDREDIVVQTGRSFTYAQQASSTADWVESENVSFYQYLDVGALFNTIPETSAVLNQLVVDLNYSEFNNETIDQYCRVSAEAQDLSKSNLNWKKSHASVSLKKIAAGQLDSDDRSDVVAFDPASSKLVALSGSSGQQLWTFDVYANIVTAVVGDACLDSPDDEAYIGTTNGVYAVRGENNQTVFSNNTIGQVNALVLANVWVTAEDTKEIIAGSQNGFVYAFNEHGQKLWQYNTTQPVSFLEQGDLDFDSQTEIVVAHGSNLTVLKGDSNQTEYRYLAPGTISGLWVGDTDKDADLEIVISVGNNVYVVDGATNSTFYSYAASNLVNDVAIGDLDDDYSNEVAVASSDLSLHVLAGKNNSVEWLFTASNGILEVEIGDFDEDGDSDVAAGDAGGNVFLLEGSNNSTISALALNASVQGLLSADIDDNDYPNIVASDGSVYGYRVYPFTPYPVMSFYSDVSESGRATVLLPAVLRDKNASGYDYRFKITLSPSHSTYDYARCSVRLDDANDTKDVYLKNQNWSDDYDLAVAYAGVSMQRSFFNSSSNTVFTNASQSNGTTYTQWVDLSDFYLDYGRNATLDEVTVYLNYSQVVTGALADTDLVCRVNLTVRDTRAGHIGELLGNSTVLFFPQNTSLSNHSANYTFSLGKVSINNTPGYDYYVSIRVNGTNDSGNYSMCGIVVDASNDTKDAWGASDTADLSLLYDFSDINVSYSDQLSDESDIINSYGLAYQYVNLSDFALSNITVSFVNLSLNRTWTTPGGSSEKCGGVLKLHRETGAVVASVPFEYFNETVMVNTPASSFGNLGQSNIDYYYTVHLWGAEESGEVTMCSWLLDSATNTTNFYDVGGKVGNIGDVNLTTIVEAVSYTNGSNYTAMEVYRFGFGNIAGEYEVYIKYSGFGNISLDSPSGTLGPIQINSSSLVAKNLGVMRLGEGETVNMTKGIGSDIDVARAWIVPLWRFWLSSVDSQITVYLKDAYDLPLQDALVTLLRDGSAVANQTTSGSGFGEATFDILGNTLPRGHYEIRAEKEGYVTLFDYFDLVDETPQVKELSLALSGETNIEVELDSGEVVTSDTDSVELRPGRPTVLNVRVRRDNGSLVADLPVVLEESRGINPFSPLAKNRVNKTTNSSGEAVFYVIPTRENEHLEITLNTTSIYIGEKQKTLWVGEYELVTQGTSEEAYDALIASVIDMSHALGSAIRWISTWGIS